MNEINVTTYNERPIDFKALQWDHVDSHEIMLKWLEDMHMCDVRFIKRRLYSNDENYIEFKHPSKKFQMDNNEPVKLFVGQYVVFNMKDHSFEVLNEHSFKAKYALKLPEQEPEEEISDEPHRGFVFLDEALRKVMGIHQPLFPEIYRSTPLRPLPLNVLRAACGLPSVPPEDLEAEAQKDFDFNEVGVDLSVEFAKAKTEPVDLQPVYEVDKNVEPPFSKLEPTMLSGLCLIKGELYGIRESDGSLDKINYGSQVFPNKPTITNVTVHTANDKKRSMQPWPTQVTDSKGVVWEVAGDGMLEMPAESDEPLPDCCGRDSEPETEDYTIEYTKYNDSTVDKGAALLQQAFPMMKTEVIFQAMTHLAENGILFREQL